MKTKPILLVIVSCGLLFLLSGAAFAQASKPESYDQAVLLMLNSNNKMQDTQDANELRQLAKYYEDYYNGMIADLQASGKDPDGKLAAELQQERDEKTAPLLAQANALDAARQRRYKDNVVRKTARFFGRLFKGGGRALGFGVSKTMEGMSKGAQIVVEEIGPHVIEDVVRHAGETIMSGGTLEGQALRKLVGELFQRHAKQVIKAKLLPKVVRAAERILGQQAAQAVAAISGQGENTYAGVPDSTEVPVPIVEEEEASGDLELTPQEQANRGTHTYLVVCHGSELQCQGRPTIQVEMSITFLEGAVKVNGIIRNKVGPNQYVWEDYLLTFTTDGMTNAFPDGSVDVYTRQD